MKMDLIAVYEVVVVELKPPLIAQRVNASTVSSTLCSAFCSTLCCSILAFMIRWPLFRLMASTGWESCTQLGFWQVLSELLLNMFCPHCPICTGQPSALLTNKIIDSFSGDVYTHYHNSYADFKVDSILKLSNYVVYIDTSNVS